LNEAQKKEIEAVVRAIPETGLDWGEAMQYEELAVTVGIHQVAEARDPAAYYQLMMSKPAPAGFSAPTSSDIAAVHKYMADEEAALRLPPSDTQAGIPAIEAEADSVKESLRPMIPGVTRVNDLRIKVQTARRGLLEALAAKGNRNVAR